MEHNGEGSFMKLLACAGETGLVLRKTNLLAEKTSKFSSFFEKQGFIRFFVP
jgi:hypothetical protein